MKVPPLLDFPFGEVHHPFRGCVQDPASPLCTVCGAIPRVSVGLKKPIVNGVSCSSLNDLVYPGEDYPISHGSGAPSVGTYFSPTFDPFNPSVRELAPLFFLRLLEAKEKGGDAVRVFIKTEHVDQFWSTMAYVHTKGCSKVRSAFPILEGLDLPPWVFLGITAYDQTTYKKAAIGALAIRCHKWLYLPLLGNTALDLCGVVAGGTLCNPLPQFQWALVHGPTHRDYCGFSAAAIVAVHPVHVLSILGALEEFGVPVWFAGYGRFTPVEGDFPGIGGVAGLGSEFAVTASGESPEFGVPCYPTVDLPPKAIPVLPKNPPIDKFF